MKKFGLLVTKGRNHHTRRTKGIKPLVGLPWPTGDLANWNLISVSFRGSALSEVQGERSWSEDSGKNYPGRLPTLARALGPFEAIWPTGKQGLAYQNLNNFYLRQF